MRKKRIIRKNLSDIISALRRFTFLLLALAATSSVYAQKQTISGKLTDQAGAAVVGAVVSEAGVPATRPVVTGVDGKYTITVSNPNAVLKFTSVGYETEEVASKGRTVVDVVMAEDVNELEAVVAIGYGVQKKVHLSGSVATIGTSKLVNRPAMNFSSSLDGLAPGVRVTQSSGNPGAEGVSIRIRGTGSFNNSAPLVLVDGIIADMTVLNSEDVESVSILKDAASAAIYGSRAANGVILVTTKKGKNEAAKVTFTAMYASERPITDLKFASSTADFMEAHNIAQLNATPQSNRGRYSKDVIAEWRRADADPNGIYTNPTTGLKIPNWLAYPNTDWAQILFKPSNYQRYTASVSGGTPKSTYLLSLGYQNNPGTLKNTGLQRFNIRANVETKILDFITIGTQTYATKEFKDPGSVSMTYLTQAFPGINPIYDGKYGASEDPNTTKKDNILQQVAFNGGRNTFTRINTSWYTNIELPLKGLVLEAKFNYSEYMRQDENYSQNLPLYSFRESFDVPKEGIGVLSSASTYRYSYGSNSYTGNLLLRYNNTFGKHDIAAVFGYEQYEYESSGFSSTKKGLIDWTVTDITSASEMYSMGGNAKSGYAMLSYFGRVNYVYDNKYLLGASFRSDASSRFAPGHRGNWFPSVSAAWRISEEKFFQPVKPFINHLKLKASYGELGNTVSGDYDWQMLYKKVNNVLDEQIQDGIVQSAIMNPSLSWEKLTTFNVGLDISFLDQRLSSELEYYYRKTDDILARGINYLTMGTIPAPMQNTASMGNSGVELTLNWNDKVRNFRYGVSVNATYNTNEILKFKGQLDYSLDNTVLDVWGNPTWRYKNLGAVTTGGDTRRTEGHMIDEWFIRKPYAGDGSYKNSDGTVNPKGGPKDGMIRTRADLDWVRSMIAANYTFNNRTVGAGAANIWYGEMIFADVNGDGKYGNNDDIEFLGKSQTPKWVFGLNLNAEWKGIDISMILSARFGSYHYINERGANGSILSNNGDGVAANVMSKYYMYDAVKAYNDPTYDPAQDPTANIYARYPRLLAASSTMVSNTFYLYNSSFIKLKSLQIGYTLPKKWLAPAKISNLRIFVSGENLLTFKDKDFPGIDPELGSAIVAYPTARLLSGGISVTF